MRIRGFLLATLLLTCSAPILLAQSDQDKTFLKDSAESGHDEIDLSKLALQKSHNADVRMFANKMIHDHTMLINSMKPFAVKWGVTPPTHMDAAGDAKYAELKVLTGETFDKEYIKAMVSDHQDALQKFDSEINSTQDARYKTAVANGRAVVQKHLDIITGIAHKYNIS
jgi:putative membrane protein